MGNTSQKFGFDELSKRVGYTFKRPELLIQALHHASYVNEQDDANLEDNERLEFLGDAVLDLAISHLLMERFPYAEEGTLSKYRALVVDELGLYRVALKLRLGNYLLLGKGEEQSSGREKPSILADAVEAFLGGVYLDAGFNKTMEVITRLFAPLLDRVETQEMVHDFKSLLQEYTQENYKTLPSYRLVKESGPAHNKIFTVILTINGRTLGQAEGKSKKEAEQKVAREAFLCLKENQNL